MAARKEYVFDSVMGVIARLYVLVFSRLFLLLNLVFDAFYRDGLVTVSK